MKSRTMRMPMGLLAAGAVIAAAAWAAASCQDNCAGDLEAALRACQVNYAKDPDNLSDCRENAQRTYQACMEDCKG